MNKKMAMGTFFLIFGTTHILSGMKKTQEIFEPKKTKAEKALMSPTELERYKAGREIGLSDDQLRSRSARREAKSARAQQTDDIPQITLGTVRGAEQSAEKRGELLKAAQDFAKAQKDLIKSLQSAEEPTREKRESETHTAEKVTREKREGTTTEKKQVERERTERETREKLATPVAPPLPTDLKDTKGKFGMYTPTESELVEQKSKLKPIPSTEKPLTSETGAIVPHQGAGPIVPATKPLDSVSGALVPYKAKPSDSSAVATSESPEKKGMSKGKKAAIGAGVAAGAAGLAGVGLIGAGAIGAAAIGGAALSGDNQKSITEVAPEKLEDIGAVEGGSGVGQSFGAETFEAV